MVRVDLMNDSLNGFFKTLLLKVLASVTATFIIWLMKMLVEII